VKIEYVTGDLLEADLSIIVQGCNAQGVMGSGIAKVIRDRYPDVFTEYKNHYDDHLGEDIMGHVVWVGVERGPGGHEQLIANAITQKFYGKPGEGIRYVSYDALAKAFETINTMARDCQVREVGMPLIGADRGGGSWKVISAIIESTATHYSPIVYLLDGKVPPT
jgi:O-acetyl-ADP-ribose deacetylase (regulator of RNase III)